MHVLDTFEVSPRPGGREAVPARPYAPRVYAATPLVALLEQHRGRSLNRTELAFARRLEQLWREVRACDAIFAHQLGELNLVDRSEANYYSYDPVIHGWWEKPPSSPLELWQYLALFAERAGRPIPEFMQAVTDTTEVRAKVAMLDRRREVEQWKRRFQELPAIADDVEPLAVAIPELRLRMASPKLVWEFRPDEKTPWRAAKGGLVRRWFAVAAKNPGRVPPATLALLQEVQLERYRAHEHGMWRPSTEPQTLKLEDELTQQLIQWLLTSETLRHLFVNEDGESYVMADSELVWSAEPVPARPQDVTLKVTFPDGSPPPANLRVLSGTPALGLNGRSIYRLPSELPGIARLGTSVVPHEVLVTPEAARHLRRAGVRVQGDLALPEVEIIKLRPRFVCQLGDGVESSPATPSSNGLLVELLARSPDGLVVQRWNGGRLSWTSLPGYAVGALSKRKNKVFEVDHRAANAAMPFLEELRLTWLETAGCWNRAVTRNFPEEFADWAELVQAAGVELECDPLLAGLTRPADRARLEIDVTQAADEGGPGVDWFDLRLVVRAEDMTLTDEDIQLLMNARGRFVLLKEKGWRRLAIDVDEAHTKRLAELGFDAAALESAGERQRFHAFQLADERIAGLLPDQHAERVRERAARLRTVEAQPPPAGLTAELRPYQCEGLHFLIHLACNGLGGVLADDMGLGKTVQALAWLLWLAEERQRATAGQGGGVDAGKRPLRALVVCPKSVVTNWELEARRFVPALTVAALGPRAEVPGEANLVVVNYTQLRLAADTLGAVSWDVVILDEGQNIKNPQSQTARVARELRATHRLVLTGTPIENRTLDLWSLFAFALPGLLGTQAAFKRTFNDRTDPFARARLARRVRHFMLRRTKTQVAADLPPRVEEDLFVELEDVQRKLYDAELKRTRQMLLGVQTAREFDSQRFNILQSLLRLRQICCDPELVGAATSSPETSAKVTALFDQIGPILEEGDKVLVFSQFVSMLDILRRELTKRRIAHLVLTGQTENRQQVVDQFQSSPDIQVFLLSLKAAGSGLNLTAASYVVLFDPWWNPAVEAQAIDRTHRIGQVNRVIAYRLLAKDTVEEKIRQLQKAKAELARAIVQEESLATVLNLDDLRFVLG